MIYYDPSEMKNFRPYWQIRLGSFKTTLGKWPLSINACRAIRALGLRAIKELPVETITEDTAHLYLWVPNALLTEGMQVMAHWGFSYKANLVWYKVRKDGGPDRRDVGFYVTIQDLLPRSSL